MRIIRKFKEKSSWATYSEAYSDDNGRTWRWVSNDSVIMLQVCRSHGIPCDEKAQEEARDKYVDETLKNYRQNQPEIPSAEEQYEMLAAFGPGKDVVDVVSGRKWRT
jgi:hypothetical protein